MTWVIFDATTAANLTPRKQNGRYWSTVPDILVQKHRDKFAAKRFSRKLLKGLRYAPHRIVTDRLRSYGAARKKILPDVIHVSDKWQNNRAENAL